MSGGIAPARRAAFDRLRAIALGRENSDALQASAPVAALSEQDRNLCVALVLGTLRWQRVLEAECSRFLSRPGQQIAEDTWLALRMGAYQLLFLDRIPAHAAIFESVEWVKESKLASVQRSAGMVNAVLRKVATQSKRNGFDAELAYPAWMTARWRKMYGAAACRALCQEGQSEPRTAVALLSNAAEDGFTKAGLVLEPAAFLADARYIAAGGIPESVPVHFQDEGSQLVAYLLGHGERILDCCAAPGGKTAILIRNNPAAQITACDIQPRRLEAMRERLARIFPERALEYRVADATDMTLTEAQTGNFDRILCDVPCTGTGTLARNPEIRHRLTPEEPARQAERQRRILSEAMRLLAPGGRLLYSTCSLEQEENEAVVVACLAGQEGQFLRRDLRMEFARQEREGIVRRDAAEAIRQSGFRDGYLRTLPGVHPCDGFFAAMLERAGT